MPKPRKSRAGSHDLSLASADSELRLLQHLCHAPLTRADWRTIARELHGYTWQRIEHGLVFGAIQQIADRGPKLLREELPAQATRMGFPDIDWTAYFPPEGQNPRPPGTAQIIRLIHALRVS
jgi:hypothetical protein